MRRNDMKQLKIEWNMTSVNSFNKFVDTIKEEYGDFHEIISYHAEKRKNDGDTRDIETIFLNVISEFVSYIPPESCSVFLTHNNPSNRTIPVEYFERLLFELSKMGEDIKRIGDW